MSDERLDWLSGSRLYLCGRTKTKRHRGQTVESTYVDAWVAGIPVAVFCAVLAELRAGREARRMPGLTDVDERRLNAAIDRERKEGGHE
jgi:hypothetical protein